MYEYDGYIKAASIKDKNIENTTNINTTKTYMHDVLY